MKPRVLLVGLLGAMAFLICVDLSAKGTNKPSPATGPEDYFPTKAGTRWTYDISVPDADKNPPLIYWVTCWPISDEQCRIMRTHSIGVLPQKGRGDGHIRLVISVVGAAKEQGWFAFPEGRELKIERDDLGIYDRGCRIFFAMTSPPQTGYQVFEVTDHDPKLSVCALEPGKWGPKGPTRGYSTRLAFFDQPVGKGFEFKEIDQTINFLGEESLDGVSCLHFQRDVRPRKIGLANTTGQSLSIFETGFTEDLWYGHGKGLVALVQTVNDKISMVWKLAEDGD